MFLPFKSKKLEEKVLQEKNIAEDIFNVSINGIIVTDLNGEIVLFNKRFIEMCQIPSEILAAENVDQFIEYLLSNLKFPKKVLAEARSFYNHQDKEGGGEIEGIDGKFFDYYSAPLIDRTRKCYGRVWFFSDITERRNKEENLKCEARFEKLLGQAAKNLIRTSPADVYSSIQDVLSRVASFLGFDRASIFLISEDEKTKECIFEWKKAEIKSYFNLMQQYPRDFFSMLDQTIERDNLIYIKDIRGLGAGWEKEKEQWLAGNVKSVLCVAINTQNRYRGFFCFEYIVTDCQLCNELNINLFKTLGELISVVLEKKELEKQLIKTANFDPLTSLPNRYQFDAVIDQMLAYSGRHQLMLAVLSLDIDNLKNVNDTYGHSIGDVLLKEVGKRCRANIRAEDFIARIGGDEFMVIVFGAKSLSEVETVAKKINEVVASEYNIEGYSVNATISIGIACYPADGQDKKALLKNADIALYLAKGAGKNSYRFFKKSYS